MTWRSWQLVGLLVVLLFMGCGKEAPEEPVLSKSISTPDGIVIESTFKPAKIRLSDEATLRLKITYPPGLKIIAPSLDGALGGFLVENFNASPRSTAGTSLYVEHDYVLSPRAIGRVETEPLVYRFVPGSGEARKVSAEVFEVEVTSQLTGTTFSLGSLEPSVSPRDIPASPWRYAVAGVAGLAILSLVVFVRSRRRKGVTQGVSLSPVQIATQKIDQLEASEATEAPEECLVALTQVVREFVEQTTEIRAPRLTTDEFLQEVREAEVFSPGRQERMGRFLDIADLVKFASQRAGTDDLSQAFDSARSFLLEDEQVGTSVVSA